MGKSTEELISLLSKECNEEVILEVLRYYKSIKSHEEHEVHSSNGILINQFTPEQGNTL